MSTGELLGVMAACGLLTFLLRLSFIAGGRHLPDDPRVVQVLRFIPPAILGALIAPEIFVLHGELTVAPDNPRLGAALLALVAARLTRSVVATIGVGMLSLWALQRLGG